MTKKYQNIADRTNAIVLRDIEALEKSKEPIAPNLLNAISGWVKTLKSLDAGEKTDQFDALADTQPKEESKTLHN